MSNTVITNYTDLNGPTTKADNSVVVIVNRDGSLSVDEKMLGTLMSKYLVTILCAIIYISEIPSWIGSRLACYCRSRDIHLSEVRSISVIQIIAYFQVI